MALVAAPDDLAALHRLIATLPLGRGVAYLVAVLDLADETVADALVSSASLPVVRIDSDTPLEPDRIHWLPRGAFASLEGPMLRRVDPLPNRNPIDALFEELGGTFKSAAVGFLFEHARPRTAFGLRALQESGGLALAEEDRARHYGATRPGIAIESRLVDRELPLHRFHDTLLSYLDHPHARADWAASGERERPASPFELTRDQVFELDALLRPLEFNVHHYKTGTLRRRLGRRMGLRGEADVHRYLEYLRLHLDERRQLVRDLLVGVTEFFRNPEAFDALAREVIDPLVERTPDGETLRAWIPGCSTGEEAYSVAILFLEAMERHDKTLPLQIFATDVDTSALSVARRGTYLDRSFEQLSRERFTRFFVPVDSGYRVHPAVRDCISFAKHDLCTDPPLSRMHLVSCRNVLIYLRRETQVQVLRSLHFALGKGGALFLGSSESLDGDVPLFEPICDTQSLFRRIEPDARRFDAKRLPAIPTPRRTRSGRVSELAEAARTTLLDIAVPPSVVVAGNDQVVYLHGAVRSYLGVPSGEARLDVYGFLRPELRSPVRAAIQRVRRERIALALVHRTEADREVKITVRSAVEPALGDGAVLISFEESDAVAVLPIHPEPKPFVVEELEQELEATRATLRSTVDELRVSSNDLRAAHEASSSINEELHATNEELEATTAELRLLNAELTDLNQRLKQKIEQVQAAHDDLNNFFASTKLAVLFLDPAFCIKRFTPAAEVLLRLSPSDVGRPLDAMARELLSSGLLDDAQAVLAELVPLEREVRTHAGQWFIRKLLPYRTQENRIEGVVVAFVDITDVKRAEELVRAREKQQAVVAALGIRALACSSVDELLAEAVERVQEVLRADLCDVLELDERAEFFRSTARVGWTDDDRAARIVPNVPAMQPGYTLHAEGAVITDDLALETRFRPSPAVLAAGAVSGMSCVIWDRDRPYGVLRAYTCAERQFTEDDANFLVAIANVLAAAISRTRYDGALRESEARYRAQANELETIYDTAPIGLAIVDRDLRFSKINRRMAEFTGRPYDEYIGVPVERAFAAMKDPFVPLLRRVFESRTPILEIVVDGSNQSSDETRHWLCSYVPLVGPGGRIDTVSWVLHDITDRKRYESALEEAARHKDQFLAMLGHELRNPLAAISAASELQALPGLDEQLQTRSREVIERQVAHMGKLVDGLLDVSRIARGLVRLDLQEVDLGVLLRDVLEDHRPRIVEQGLTLEADLPSRPVPLRADPTRVWQIIDNLLSNAEKYTEAPGRIRVVLERRGAEAFLRIRDTGRGIDPALLARLFEPFRQADQPIDRSAGGLGLGLAVVKGMVELHGGRVRAISKGIGHGAEFVVSFPLDAREESASRVPEGASTVEER